MGLLLYGVKVFENPGIVVYEVRHGDESKAAGETVVIEKDSTENWVSYKGVERWAGHIYSKARRSFEETGTWPSRTVFQS